jgi:NAD(P)-dependent dehydrogenase (short-subunit alcohol dehydrogenase family)
MNKFSLENRTAIITGGAQGFGLAMTERFLDSGANVIIWDIDKLAVEKTIKKLNNSKLSSVIVDVTNFDQVLAKAEEITKSKKIDIFINNAGIAGQNATVWDYPVEEWKKVLDLNLNAVFYCLKAITPHMIKNNYGRIVNIASTPAAAKTRIFDQMTKEHINYMLSKIPRNRFILVEELASLVTWLVSEENSYTTGAVFDLSGGRATY